MALMELPLGLPNQIFLMPEKIMRFALPPPVLISEAKARKLKAL